MYQLTTRYKLSGMQGISFASRERTLEQEEDQKSGALPSNIEVNTLALKRTRRPRSGTRNVQVSRMIAMYTNGLSSLVFTRASRSGMWKAGFESYMDWQSEGTSPPNMFSISPSDIAGYGRFQCLNANTWSGGWNGQKWSLVMLQMKHCINTGVDWFDVIDFQSYSESSCGTLSYISGLSALNEPPHAQI